MEVQVKFPGFNKLYSYECINGGKVGDRVIILEGKLTGREASIRVIGRGNYTGKLIQCWRPEFDESLIEEWCDTAKKIEKNTRSSRYGKFNDDTN